MYGIYIAFRTTQTAMFGGEAWVIDGELGRILYPTSLTLSEARELYRQGKAPSCPVNDITEMAR